MMGLSLAVTEVMFGCTNIMLILLRGLSLVPTLMEKPLVTILDT